MSEHSHDNKPGELEESRLVVDNDFEVAPVNDRLFGSFVEHLGRCVYDGIYEPGHPKPMKTVSARTSSNWSRNSALPRFAILAAISFPAIAGRMALVLVMSGRVAWTWHGLHRRPISLVCTKWRNGWKKPAATS